MANTRQQRTRKNQSKWPVLVRRVNVFIQRTSRTEVLTFLLFVAIAAFFWFVQTRAEVTDSEFTVHLVIRDQPQDKVFTTRVPSELKVTISDTNSRLFNYGFHDRLDTLAIDFERYADAVGNFRVSAAELQSLLREELEGSTKIVSVSPTLIDARFAQTEGRRIPVRLAHHYRIADNHRIRPVLIEPDSVTVNAPSTVLDTMRWVFTMPSGQRVQLLTDTLTEQLQLSLPLGVKATPSHVKVTVPVSEYVQKVFDRLVVRVQGEPEGYRLVVFPYAVRLSCLVDIGTYRTLTDDQFLVTADYRDVPVDVHAGSIPLTVRYVGADTTAVTCLTLSPATAEYVIEKQ